MANVNYPNLYVNAYGSGGNLEFNVQFFDEMGAITPGDVANAIATLIINKYPAAEVGARQYSTISTANI